MAFLAAIPAMMAAGGTAAGTAAASTLAATTALGTAGVAALGTVGSVGTMGTLTASGFGSMLAAALPSLGTVGTALNAAGMGMSALGAIRQGQSGNIQAKYEARMLEENAKQTTAAGHHQAREYRRRSDLAMSRALAVAGASGAGVVDPSVLNIIGGIAGEGERGAETLMFNARSDARFMGTQATATRFSGKQARRAGMTTALGMGAYGASRMFGDASAIDFVSRTATAGAY